MCIIPRERKWRLWECRFPTLGVSLRTVPAAASRLAVQGDPQNRAARLRLLGLAGFVASLGGGCSGAEDPPVTPLLAAAGR